eukprot:s3972_g1.t1
MFLPVASLGIDKFCRVKNNLRPQRTALSCEDCEAIGLRWEVHSFDWFSERCFRVLLCPFLHSSLRWKLTSSVLAERRLAELLSAERKHASVLRDIQQLQADRDKLQVNEDSHEANTLMRKALEDFTMLCKVAPKNKDGAKKLTMCQRWLEKALNDFFYIVSPYTAYNGPLYVSGSCTADFCQHLMEHQKKEQSIPKKFAVQIVRDMIELLKASSTLVDIEVPEKSEVTICGDIHGQFYDLLNIFSVNGPPSEENPYLFNGDFVDRGSFSVEVILTLFAWKLAFPKHMHLARGNHETRSMNKLYGFEGEVTKKYVEDLYQIFCEAFCLLPLCHVINQQVFVVHGGLFSRDDVTLDAIRKVNRDCEPPDGGLMTEMLWSDPQPGRGRAPSKRGIGVAFGPDVTDNFLRVNNLKMVIRSHEMKEEGYEIEHSGKLVTVFSAPNYCDRMGNKGAFIRLDGKTMTPKYTTFAHVSHPNVRPTHYTQM